MLKEIIVRNLRSIYEAKISPARLTVFYGPNGSGKSSLMHALAIFKNVLRSPGSPADPLFRIGATDLGGFEQVVSEHARHQSIQIHVTCSRDHMRIQHTVQILGTGCTVQLQASGLKLDGDTKTVNLAWPGGAASDRQTVHARVDAGDATWMLEWDGAVAWLSSYGGPGAAEVGGLLADALNCPSRLIRTSQSVPLNRGFSKPHYSRADRHPATYDEDELANLLFMEPSLETQVDQHLHAIVGRNLQAKSLTGTGLFTLETVDPETRLTTTLVNEGAGINQVTYLLTQSLLPDASLITIEEPEIHLHPNAVRRLAYALADIANAADRTFMLSTHSETFVVALLGAVAQGTLDPQDLACYLVTKQQGRSTFEAQRVTRTGQIEGGLTTFMEAQLEDLKSILGIADKGK
jgi:hypothetical protein